MRARIALALCILAAPAPALAQEPPSRAVCEAFAAQVEGELGKSPDALQINTLLFQAAHKGCAPSLQRLLQAGASRLARNREGDTALAIAAKAGRAAIVESLLAGASPAERRQLDTPDAQGATPLMLAIHAGRAAIARTLLQAGADVDAVNAQGETPLSEAAYAADAETGALLLARGAKAATVDRSGKAPICYAAARGATRLVERMLDAGVDVNAAYGHGLTAAMWAAGFSDLTATADAVATLKLIIARGAKLDSLDDRGRSALMIAAALNRFETARVLRQAGADPGLRDKSGRTAADLAATAEMRDLLK
jgi:ankyrin repeat protein